MIDWRISEFDEARLNGSSGLKQIKITWENCCFNFSKLSERIEAPLIIKITSGCINFTLSQKDLLTFFLCKDLILGSLAAILLTNLISDILGTLKLDNSTYLIWKI